MLKYILTRLLMPFSISLGLLIVGVILLEWEKTRRWGKWAVLAGTVLLLGMSLPMFSRSILREGEAKYPTLMPRVTAPDAASLRAWDVSFPVGQTVWIVVLGTGLDANPDLPVGSQAGSTFLERFVEAARLSRVIPGSRLAVSVSGKDLWQDKRRFVEELAMVTGLDASQITMVADANDTREEAMAFRRVAGANPVVLVTSANHMPRAVAIFKSVGLLPIVAPTDHGIRDAPSESFITLNGLLPSASSLGAWDRIGYEWLGTLNFQRHQIAGKE